MHVEVKVVTTRGEVTIVQHQTKARGRTVRTAGQVLDAAVRQARAWLKTNPEPDADDLHPANRETRS